MKKIISILGSTGSIGLTTLKIIEKKRDIFKINLLMAHSNLKEIVKQINKFQPNYFIIDDFKIYKKIKKLKLKKKTKILNNLNYSQIKIKNDYTVTAIPGLAGLKPSIELVKFSKKLLIANKESIICGWNIIFNLAKKNGTKIIPLDSEHFSLEKLMSNHNLNNIKKFYITASGGPFLNHKISQLKNISSKDALKHPKWKMGKKISVDSATLMNKILECIEAQKLFNIPQKKIEIVIHPNSLVHSIIELNNGLLKFIYHDTSMLIPLANAIFDDKLNINDFYTTKKWPFDKNLIFMKPNKKKFPILKIKNLITKYPSTPIIINAANEILVTEFLREKLPYLAISKIIMSVLRDRNYKKNAIKRPKNLSTIIKIDQWARDLTLHIINQGYA